MPRAFYVASDAVRGFVRHNNLEEVYEQKYKEIDQVRLEYPHLVQVFKNSTFPPEIVKGLSVALDDFGEAPLIVRSSSLLEDRLGTAFAGKYKSLFLANQGTKSERLAALTDAIAEVYASLFSPDPIEYRAERGLLDFHEEMGIMIQEVVGRRVGDYFLPAFAGVAFSNNEFRWSPRIKREDGLVRLVPGLGTRAVDRVPDDYPVLIAPGQPQLRANVSVEDVMRYSPHKLDVINLETGVFETADLRSPNLVIGNDGGILSSPDTGNTWNSLNQGLGDIQFYAIGLDPSQLIVQTYLNGKKVQEGHTKNLIFSVPFLVHYLSQCMTLFPGDIISTGTPRGVGPMKPGDLVFLKASRRMGLERVAERIKKGSGAERRT